MRRYIRFLLCILCIVLVVAPSIKADIPEKDVILEVDTDTPSLDWISYGKQKAYHLFLFANRLCDHDILLAWPVLGQEIGYEMMPSIDLFLKANALRLLICVASHEFDQSDEARASLKSGFVLRTACLVGSRLLGTT